MDEKKEGFSLPIIALLVAAVVAVVFLVWNVASGGRPAIPSGIEVQKPTGIQADPNAAPPGGVMGPTGAPSGGAAPLPPGKGGR